MKCIDLELCYNTYLYHTPCPLHASWIELYLNTLIEIWIDLNWTQNQLENNEMQIGGETIEILLVNIVLEKKTFKNIDLKKTHFHVSLFGNGLNQDKTPWNLIVVLLKPILMNHYQ